MLIFDLLYGIVFLFMIPFWLKKFLSRQYFFILKGRFSPTLKPSLHQRIWIHAVSVGEVKSLGSLIDRLTREYRREVVLSVTTPAGFQVAKQMYSAITVVNAPVDFSFVIKNFMHRINPEILVLHELEIWPNWILLVKRAGVPVVLINGRISDSAFKKYHLFSFFLKRFFTKIDLFMVQAHVYKQRFNQLGIPGERIEVCGNIKADEAFELQKELQSRDIVLNYLKVTAHDKPVLTVASSHAADEKILIPAIKRIFQSVSIILVPRHLDRIGEIMKKLSELSINHAIWSKSTKVDLNHQVLIFDKIGYLFHILAISDVVFMGGTFSKEIGGHNLYEPAVLGKLIVGGPHYNNFPVIGQELVENKVYLPVSGTEGLVKIINHLSTIDMDKVQSNGQSLVRAKRGSVECILSHIRLLIDS